MQDEGIIYKIVNGSMEIMVFDNVEYADDFIKKQMAEHERKYGFKCEPIWNHLKKVKIVHNKVEYK